MSLGTADRPGSRLCASCKSFELKFLDFPVTYVDDDGIHPNWDHVGKHLHMGTLHGMRQKPDCALCQLVLRIIETQDPEIAHRETNRDPITLRDTKSPITCSLYWCLKTHMDQSQPKRPEDRSMLLGIKCSSMLYVDTYLFNHVDAALGHGIRTIQYYARDRGDFPAKIGLASFWLRTCVALHGSDCHRCLPISPATRAREFTFVDVQDQCLVELPFCDVKYTALSYVRGPKPFWITNSEASALHENSGLAAVPIPKTVEDAMTLTKWIGVRYLWVDCLCAPKSDEQANPTLTSIGDIIFPGAFLTIVALDGHDAHHGLYVEPNQQPNWDVRINDEVTLVSVKAGLPESTHETDAWTFHEVVLSRRRLVFRGDLIFFACQNANWREDLITENDEPTPGHNPLLAQFSYWNIEKKLQRQSMLMAYESCVRQYTSRKTGEADDAADPFSPLSRLFKKHMITRFHFGLPRDLIDWALLWRPVGEHSPRVGFPSWSWQGWVGPVEFYFFQPPKFSIFLCSHTWIYYYFDSAAGRPIDNRRRPRRRYQKYLRNVLKVRPEVSDYDPLDTLKGFVNNEELPTVPTYSGPPVKPGLLRFFTVSAHFELVPQDGICDYMIPKGLLMKDKVGGRAGFLELGGSRNAWSPQETASAALGIQEIILLSEGFGQHRIPFPDEQDASDIGAKRKVRYTDGDGHEKVLSKKEVLKYYFAKAGEQRKCGDELVGEEVEEPEEASQKREGQNPEREDEEMNRSKQRKRKRNETDDDVEEAGEPIGIIGDDCAHSGEEKQTEIVADSPASSEGGDNKLRDPSKWTIYYVMAIRWEDGIARRIATGWLHRDALLRAADPRPQWKEIVLG